MSSYAPIRWLLLPFLLLLFCLSGGRDLHAQQFGQNKVQYRTFHWRYIQSEHFDIYFYDSAGTTLSKFTAFVGEEALVQLEEHLRYRITARIPIVIYNSHNDFQQTNVVGGFLPEGVGGVTELFKNRVTVPFEGDWEKFRHVVRHELVHAVLNDKFYGGSIQSLISNNVRFMLPIWMNEGLAEYEARGGYDVETDMFIRDAVLGDYLPPLERLGNYFAYRGGQAFYWYVEQTYGREKIAELLSRCRTLGDIDAAFKGAFGKTLEEFSEQWVYDMKKLYFPDIADRRRPVDFALRLTDHKKDDSYFNTSPSLSPNGDKLAWISDRDGYRSVFYINVATPSKVHRVVQGEENVDFEELHLITPAIAWSPDGTKISLAVKSDGGDAIYIIDVESNSRQKFSFKLDAIYSVDWSPDGKRLAFQGIRGEQSDIYVYDIEGEHLENVTDDIFSDGEPNWSTDGTTLYFISDRRNHPIGEMHSSNFRIWNYNYLSRDLYSVVVATHELRRLTTSEGVGKSSPTAIGEKTLLYVSDKNGISNVYLLDLETLASRPLTNSISGIEQLSASRDGSMIAFTAWNADGQDVFLLRSPSTTRVAGDTLAPTTYLTRIQRNTTSRGSTELPPDVPVTAVTPLVPYGDVSIDVADALPPPNRGRGGLPPTTGLPAPLSDEDARLVSGDFVANDYKVKFSTDIIQATGNYSSFYGVQGSTQMLFSDMLGDHQIYVATSLLLDLKNSDFLVSYYYLPERIDYGIDAFHSSRFVGLHDGDGKYILARFRQYGLQGHSSSPFDRFSRLDLGLNFVRVSREPLEGNTIQEQSKTMLVPSVSYIFDNTRDWAFNPASGSRYNATVMASPAFGPKGVGFYSFLIDARHYIAISKYGDYSLGGRIAAGASFGPNPQKFFVGGVENWLNFDIRNNQLPIENAEDFTYVTPGYPLRGYRYSEQVGTKYLLGNLEFRFPLFRALVTGPVPLFFQYVSGVLFLDMGSAWTDSFHPFHNDPIHGALTDDLLIGSGIGARAYVFGFPVRMDIAWNYNLDAWSEPVYYFSLGYDF